MIDRMVESDSSIVIGGDVDLLPEVEAITDSYRKRALIVAARGSMLPAVLIGVSHLAALVDSGSLSLSSSVSAALTVATGVYGSTLAQRRELDRAAYIVLGGMLGFVVVQSLLAAPVLALACTCVGYPVLLLCTAALVPSHHISLWTRAMPVLFAATVVTRHALNPIDFLAHPLDLLTLAGGGAVGMTIVSGVLGRLLRALRHSLKYSEMVRGGLEMSRRQIVAHQQALEVRVRERTRDLEAKNLSLADTLDSLRRTQAQLVQSEKMASLGLLVAGIAHEIKNPLNFVNNFAELGLDFIREHREARAAGTADDGATEDVLTNVAGNLEKIRDHGHRSNMIINSMLIHARARRGEPVEVDLNSMLVEHTSLAYHGFRASDRSFTTEVQQALDPTLKRIMVPYQEVARLAVNLASNAFHAMREAQRQGRPGYQPLLRITTKRDDDDVVFSVGDNGLGMTPEVRHRIFDPFFTTKPPGEGTGLGLSMCYEIVIKDLGGVIDVESEVGVGTTFTVRFPLRQSSLNREPGSKSATRP